MRDKDFSIEKVIEVAGLTKKFGNFKAVDKISFDVYKGEIFGFLGANGAGKTTAMRMLSGLLLPTSGQAIVAGYNVRKSPDKVKQNIGYMSQHFSLYDDLTVKENIRLFGGIYGLSRSELLAKQEDILQKLELVREKDSMVKSLPLGWKQKLAFSIAMIHNPKVVFLDEPTGGVDPVTRRKFWELIYQAADEGTTLFVTTHYMDESEYCDRVSIMVDGEIKALASPKGLKDEYGKESMQDVFHYLARGVIRTE